MSQQEPQSVLQTLATIPCMGIAEITAWRGFRDLLMTKVQVSKPQPCSSPQPTLLLLPHRWIASKPRPFIKSCQASCREVSLTGAQGRETKS